MSETYRFKRVELRREISAAVTKIIADKEIAYTFYHEIMTPIEDFLSDKEVCEEREDG